MQVGAEPPITQVGYLNSTCLIGKLIPRNHLTPLRYLRKAHNFNRKGATRIPRSGYRQNNSAVYRKGNEFLIVRPDAFGIDKIVTYGINED